MKPIVFAVRVPRDTEEKYSAVFLSAADEKHKKRYSDAKNRDQAYISLVGNVLSLYALNKTFGLKMSEIKIGYGEKGKPFPEGRSGEKYFFSVSHSGDVCVCAVSDSEVGVDVERIRDVNAERIAKRFFSKDEKEYIGSFQNEYEKKRAFFTVWTKHESAVKLSGRGISDISKPIGDEVLSESTLLFGEYVLTISIFTQM
ncbi:MAG: 4'-phosphopantetheinyl transferase superfamily protein [Clostridiales bacterium]|nr:4'-phosphopantetheinyl transferase superfamily protein [Clostridiales bacterium]